MGCALAISLEDCYYHFHTLRSRDGGSITCNSTSLLPFWSCNGSRGYALFVAPDYGHDTITLVSLLKGPPDVHCDIVALVISLEGLPDVSGPFTEPDFI